MSHTGYQKLPIGMQDFTKIREGNCVYVDKTQLIAKLIATGSVYFLSRPRRFGKSLLISTLEAIFQGKKELFKGLWIEQSDYDWKRYPVIRIDMSETVRTSPELLAESLIKLLKRIAESHQLDLGDLLSPSDAFSTLISRLAESGKKAVVLVDEYDKPIIDNISNPDLALNMRDILRPFYGILKAQDGNLKFILLTGVTKFSKASVFSELNNLQDLTLTEQYSHLLGYTQVELEKVFADRIAQLAEKYNHTIAEELDQIKKWYNGYRFSAEGESVYNPFSTLLLLEQQTYMNHWFATATPKFLIDLLETRHYAPETIEGTEINFDGFGSYDIERLELLPLLYQTGYLTIRSYDPRFRTYLLGYPNLEVEQSFKEAVLNRLAEIGPEQRTQLILNLIRALEKKDYTWFFEVLKSFFARLPYELHQPTEAYYHSIFYLIFHLLSYPIGAEVHTNLGRIDAVIELPNRILIFEFKLNQSADVALKQIHDKQYYAPYVNMGKEIVLIGVEFSTELRNVKAWRVETK
jgi:hypothetical protein